MLAAIAHLGRVAHSLVREAGKRVTRSPHWRAVEKEHLQKHPECAGCGGKDRLQVHHQRPFHLFPSLELEPTNLVTLCMGKDECHLTWGHSRNWKAWNPKVLDDAAMTLEDLHRIADRAARAKADRKGT